MSIDNSNKYPGLHVGSSLSPSPSNSVNSSQNNLLGLESLQSSPTIDHQDRSYAQALSATIGSSSMLSASRDASKIFDDSEIRKRKTNSLTEAMSSSITDVAQLHRSVSNGGLNNNNNSSSISGYSKYGGLSAPKYTYSSFGKDNNVEDGFVLL